VYVRQRPDAPCAQADTWVLTGSSLSRLLNVLQEKGYPVKTNQRIAVSAAVVALILSVAGCSGMSTRDQYTAGGAAAGAVAGAVLTGGSAVGTVGGAAVGGIIGNEVGKKK
jgi:osmotically inducible lipoprotein OsmB